MQLKEIFGLSCTMFVVVCSSVVLYYSVDELSSKTNFEFKVPHDFEDAKELNQALSKVFHENYHAVYAFFVALYILKQTFSIPGSLVLNVLAGNIFGFRDGFIIVHSSTVLGAACCYFLSGSITKRIIEKKFKNQIKKIQALLEQHKDNLLFYLLFMRMVPFTPHWLLNLISPLVGVPFHYFIISILIGMIPYDVVGVQAGSILSEIQSASDVLDKGTIAKLSVLAAGALVPILLKKKLKNKPN